MKKALLFASVFTLTLLAGILLFMLPASAETVGGNCGDMGTNITWSFDTQTGVLSFSGSGNMNPYEHATTRPWHAYRSSTTSIVLDSSISSICRDAFCDYGNLKSITLPAAITVIPSGLFANCSELESVTLGNGITHIEDLAFSGCTKLRGLTLPDSVVSISHTAFQDCASALYNQYDNAYYLGTASNPYHALVKASNSASASCNIHENTKLIVGYAFYDCSNLQSLAIPGTVISIGDWAFAHCSALSDLSISASVTKIGKNVFYLCSNLSSITVDAANPTYASVDGNLYSKDLTQLIQYACGKTAKKFTIPDTVSRIGTDAFSGCTNLTSITIPTSVTLITNGAFNHCSNLEKVRYLGTKEEWREVFIAGSNEPLTSVTTMLFGPPPAESESEDDDDDDSGCGSVLSGGIAMMALTLLAGGMVVKKRKK